MAEEDVVRSVQQPERFGGGNQASHNDQRDAVRVHVPPIDVRDHDENGGRDQSEAQRGDELPHVLAADRHHVHHGFV